MPNYSFHCSCGNEFDEFYKMSDDSSSSLCKCGKTAKKRFTVPGVVTDTSFFATGEYDARVCDNKDDKIQGREDWHRRLEERNLMEIDQSVLDAPLPQPTNPM